MLDASPTDGYRLINANNFLSTFPACYHCPGADMSRLRVNVAVLCGAALLAMFLTHWLGHRVFLGQPVSTDEGSYVFQAYAFRDGTVSRPYPAMGTMIRRPNDMLIMDREIGWTSRYPPGHALWLLPGTFLDSPRSMVTLASGLAVLGVGAAALFLGIPVAVVPLLALVSPFFLLMYGTLLSHTSGWVAVSLLLAAYIRMRQTGRSIHGAIAGLAWALLFLNRTYTAVLLALPFAVDSLVLLGMRRNWHEFRKAVAFAGGAGCGVIGYLFYNWLVAGDPLTPTYLFYDATQTLGFGRRHLHGLPVDHGLLRGLHNAWTNLLTLDRWLTGISFSLPLYLVLAGIGWSKRWSPLLLGGILALVGGYVFFWFPGPRHIGPAYYFELMPFLLLLAGLGCRRCISFLAARSKMSAAVVPVLVLLLVMAGSVRFLLAEQEYFNGVLDSQARIAQTLAEAPADSLVFFQNIEYPPFGKLTVNERGVASDPLVMTMPPPDSVADILRFYPDRTAFLLSGHDVDRLLPVSLAGGNLLRTREAVRMAHRTGENGQVGDIPVRMANEEDHPAHYLAFGFRQHLPPGKYVASFYFEVSEGAQDTRIDVATDLGQTILAREYKEGAGRAMVHQLPFEIEQDDFVLVEPRVFYGGHGSVALSRITLRLASGDDA